jgi:NAD(P)-dependent dehydrogenase (short-subunit alcohol dehydrogenase family)
MSRREASPDLSGKVALVTGGSRGLGREIVRAFARRGADVVIASRKLAACEELASEVRLEHEVRALAVACNVGDWDQCDSLVRRVHHELGRVDVLVNNAGMSPLYEDLDGVTEQLYDKVLAVNLKGPFRLSVRVGTAMADGDGGSIVNVSSISALRPVGDALPYAMAKGGLNVLTQGLAQALAPKVRVNAIVAGPFRTDIATAWTEQAEARMRRALALGRIGEPVEIVGAALFFASDASSYCTGALLRVDGGAL